MTSYGSEVLMGAPGEIRIDGAKQTDGSVTDILMVAVSTVV